MRRFLKKVIWKLNLIKNFFFKNRKYLIKKKEFNNILKYGSNHPRRVDYFKFGHVFKEKNNVLDFFNPWLLRTRENVINIVFGEFSTTFSVTSLIILVLVVIKSSLLIPGFLARPEVIITKSEFLVSE